MKRTLLIITVILLMLLSCATAEDTSFKNEYFTITLPDGIEPIDDANAFAAAAENDYGEAIKTILIASDPAQISLVAVTVIDSLDSLTDAAAKAAEVLLGNSDTVSAMTLGDRECAVFTCSIDAVKYRFYYLSNGTQLFCVTCAGLTPEDEEAMIASFSAF